MSGGTQRTVAHTQAEPRATGPKLRSGLVRLPGQVPPKCETETKTTADIDRGRLRKLQRETLELAEQICIGDRTGREFIVSATPGAGKTMTASLFAHRLYEGGRFDVVIWIVPCNALLNQAADGFTNEDFYLFKRIVPRKGKNLCQDGLLERSKEIIGFVTTYQSAIKYMKGLLRTLEGKRVLLILDEFHHVAESGEEEGGEKWFRQISKLYERADMVLLMSGTVERHDGNVPVGVSSRLVPYKDESGGIVKKLDPDVVYTRADALAEQAVLPISFFYYDGQSKYEVNRREHTAVLSKHTTGRSALNVALDSPEFWQNMVDDAICDKWVEYQRAWYQSKAIVVCKDQKHARAVAEYLAKKLDKKMGSAFKVALAISDDPDEARRTLDAFRSDSGRGADILVTVNMAYEGFNVPQATHLVYLTNKNSRPYMTQCFARVMRPNYKCGVPVDKQAAYIFVTHTHDMVAFIESMLDEQELLFQERERVKRESERTTPPKVWVKGIGASPTDTSFGDIYGGKLSDDDNKRIALLHEMHALTLSWPIPEALKLARSLFPNVGTKVA